MWISPETRATLLLTADLAGDAATRPLGVAEWSRLARWLKARSLEPAALLANGAECLAGWADEAMPPDRLDRLLARRADLEATLAGWDRAGLWVLSHADAEYPKRLKRRLRARAPFLLFGAGDRQALNRGGIALEAVSEDALGFACGFAGLAARAGLSVLARLPGGPAEESPPAAALLAALSRDGGAIGLTEDDLLEAGADPALAPHLRPGGSGVLVTTRQPGRPSRGADALPAGRTVPIGLCLYGLCDAALLARPVRRHLPGALVPDPVWEDAATALDHEWVPVWLRQPAPDMSELLRRGARPLPDDETSPRTLLAHMAPAISAAPPGFAEAAQPFPMPPSAGDTFGLRATAAPRPPLRLVSSDPATPARLDGAVILYEAFMRQALTLLEPAPLAAATLARVLQLVPEQAERWLDRACAEGRVVREEETGLYRRAAR